MPRKEGDELQTEQLENNVDNRSFSRDYKALLSKQILQSVYEYLLQTGVEQPEEVIAQLEVRAVPSEQEGDLGFPCFTLAKLLKRNPKEIASEIATYLSGTKLPYIERFEAVGPYVNAFIDFSEFGRDIVSEVLEAGANYGSENIGQGFHYVIDMSSPNIAKPMSVGHLRSTIIGDALTNTLEHLGFKVTKDNHLGDWGTQFGYLMLGLEKYGVMDSIDASDDPIAALKDVYVSITAEGKTDEGVAQGARDWFRRLEQGDPAARALWQKIYDWSIQEFERVYQRLGVTFDVWQGESFYETMLTSAIDYVKESGAATLSEGAVIVDLRNAYNRLVSQWLPELGLLLSGLEDLENPEALHTSLWETLQQAYALGKAKAETDPEAVKETTAALEKGRTKLRTAAMDILSLLISHEQQGDEAVNLSATLAKLFDKNAASDEGVMVSDAEELNGKDLGVQVLQKSDGASLYVTREIATALYRERQMNADGMIYVVGGEQQLYFQQFFELLKRMNSPLADKSHHVWFGMVKGVMIDPETGTMKAEKMSTRKGTTILLQDVINEAVVRAQTLLKTGEKSKLTEAEQDQIAEQVAVGALKWNDLKSDPHREIVFNWDEMLSMSGNSAPYVMYSRARALGLLERAGVNPATVSDIVPTQQIEKQILLKLSEFTEAVRKVADTFTLSSLANYLYELSQLYNSLYNELPILNTRAGETLTDEESKTRIAISAAVAQTIENGLRLLGIPAPARM